MAALGSLLIGLSPFWLRFLADLPQVRAGRRRLYCAVVASAMLLTIAVGIAWFRFWAGPDMRDLVMLAVFAVVLLLGCLPVACVDFVVRRRRVRQAVWRAEHPHEDLMPLGRGQRAVRRELDAISRWSSESVGAMAAELHSRGWVTSGCIRQLDESRPECALLGSARASVERYVAKQSASTRMAVDMWSSGVRAEGDRLNADHVRAVRDRRASFFDSVERSPLTDEQIDAVVCMDDRVRLIAAAGSGKTSTLVAKAAYAVAEGLVQSDRVLVLAFNEAAAREARERLHQRLRLLNLPDDVEVRTFHSLGSTLVGRARGRKPALSPAVAQQREAERLAGIVAQLCEQDPVFAGEWALFRAVYADTSVEETARDALPAGNTLLTRSGDLVRSRGEQLIADWLWFQGVEFVYEQPYAFDTADAEHRQYTPDFYYPSIDLWHEHLALDADGAAPAHFDGYQQGVDWKRRTHAHHGTRLLETTTAQIDDGSLMQRLSVALQKGGVVLRPDADRSAKGRPLLPENRLLDLVGTALRTTKRDGVDAAEFERRARMLRGGSRTRAQLFGRLLAPIRREWDARLVAEEKIDFEGMLLEAAEALETGLVTAEYDLVLVDEFQDLNTAFERMLHSLLRRPRSRLFAVGDDWQAINGFAGADVQGLLAFEQRFGSSSTLRLERTFRSSQPICDAAGTFIMQNPEQLPKSVVSDQERVSSSVRIAVVNAEQRQSTAVERFLRDLQSRIDSARAAGRPERDRSVLVLGRYNRTAQFAPDLSRYPALRCAFSTIHQAKGQEADYVVLLDVVSGVSGFPSTKVDDPVLGMLRSAAETFPHAEERRLLYVAMTRARRAVLLVTTRDAMSPFVSELSRMAGVTVENEQGEDQTFCPSCGAGVMESRVSAYGPFFVCSRRQCEFKRDVRRMAAAPAVAGS